MQNVTRWIVAMTLLMMFSVPQLTFAAAKKYQVTGKVTALTDDLVTIEKADGEKWEINRDSNSVVKGDLKVGEKVTIEYEMTAAKIDVKPAK